MRAALLTSLVASLAGLIALHQPGHLGAAPSVRLTQNPLSSQSGERLDRGEVQVRLDPVPGSGIREGVATAVIDFPPERVFRAIADLEHWDEWVPFLAEADAVVLPGGEIESAQRLELPGFLGTRRFRVYAQVMKPGAAGPRRWSVAWSYVPGSGNIAAQRGAWTLVEHAPGRTLATCRLYTDPGGFAPASAMNSATEKMLRWMFKALPLQTNRGRYREG